MTVHTIVERLGRIYEGATADGEWSAAVSATMGQARVPGLIVDKHAHAIKPLDQWTETELGQLLGDDRI